MNRTTRRQVAKLNNMRVNELQAKFAEVTGDTTRSPNKTFLIRRITEALEAAEAAAEAQAVQPAADCSSEAEPEVAVEYVEYEEAEDGVEYVEEAAEQPGGERLTALDVPTLQARYLEVIGRPTSSNNKDYLVWKIREAQKGRVPVGPRKSQRREGVTFKVLPLRMEADLVDKLDEAWRRQGLRSRMELFRRSLQLFLANAGEADLASVLGNADA